MVTIVLLLGASHYHKIPLASVTCRSRDARHHQGKAGTRYQCLVSLFTSHPEVMGILTVWMAGLLEVWFEIERMFNFG